MKVNSLLKITFVLILSLFLSTNLFAQNRTVSGTITGTGGEPLQSASVLVKNSNAATTADAAGRFVITVPSANSILVISYSGYKTIEVAVNGKNELSVDMQIEQQELANVIVVGYGTQRRISTTGSIASVKASDITQTPVVNVAQGLQARVSGVQITQNSAAPGGNISVRIRGTNSINGTSEPLYVVDGIQISNSGGINDVSPLSSINPNDIESVEVLKDASSTAIYGSRGANGVVLITTKRGRNGATRVNYESYYGTQQVTKTLDLLNASQFAKLENEVNNRILPYYTNPDSLGEGTDWQKFIFRNAPIQNHQLSINGGSEKTQFAISANYFNQDGVVIASQYKRYSLRLNLDHRINDNIKFGTSILSTYGINNTIPGGGTGPDGGAINGLVGAALNAPPTLKPYKEDGTFFSFPDQLQGAYRESPNPLAFARVLNQSDVKRTLANLYGEVSLLRGLTYRASFNVDLQNNLNNFYSPRSIVTPSQLNDNSGTAGKSNGNSTVLLHESILTFSRNFRNDHSLKFTGVFATQVDHNNNNSINATGFPNDATTNEALSLALNRTINSSRSKQNIESYLGRINYGFKDKFFVDLTARLDGASKFGANHKYGFFPAASAAWRLIEENFLKGSKVFSDLKLRVSYGITGNAGAIGPYQSLATVSPLGSYNFNHLNTTGIGPTGISNEDLRWERSTQTDIGLDIGFLNDRIRLVFDVYDKQTNDLLYVRQLPLSSGYSNYTGNFATIQNKGVEALANVRILEGIFKWNASANISFNQNKVVSLDGTTNETFVSTYSLIKTGQPLGIYKTYVFNGIYQTGETVLPGSDSRIGGVKVTDVNKDGRITADDQVITGDPNPDYIFGFSSNVSYKNLDLNLFLSGVQGNDIFNYSRYTFETPLGQRNGLSGLANRWSATNPSNEFVNGSLGARNPTTSRFVEHGSYVRLKNITLGYTLPAIKGIYRSRFYVSGNNLFTITNYSGFDPEVNSYAGSNTSIGVDNIVYPSARSFLVGLQITF